jgi:hypothetical protein
MWQAPASEQATPTPEHALVRQSNEPGLHAHALPRHRGPGLHPVWQLAHCPPVPPHCVSLVPAAQVPPPARLVQQPPLHPVFAPPQSPWHECSPGEHAVSAAQSAATLQPHAPLTHAVLVLCAEQLTHAPPPVPHADAARPLAHVPFAQHPPLQCWLALHDVVHFEPSQA